MDFKPNIYPVMYWALAYGVAAGLILFVVYLLSRFITIVWFPVFLTGVVFGGFRNWRKQKDEWHAGQGTVPEKRPMMDEFKAAVSDITVASREMMAQQAQEDAQVAQEQAAEQEFAQEAPTVDTPQESAPQEETPEPPTQPPVPPMQPPAPPAAPPQP